MNGVQAEITTRTCALTKPARTESMKKKQSLYKHVLSSLFFFLTKDMV